MLIGEPRRLDVIESYVRSLDKRISASFSLSGAANYSSVVVPVISGQTAKVKEMLSSLLESNPRRSDYKIEETAVKELVEGQDSMKLLMIAGPREELDVLRKWADQLDAQLCLMAGIDRDTSPESFKQVYEVVDLKYIEPIHAQFDLTARVRGLYVTILPDPVTPGLTGENSDSKQATGDTGTGGTAGASTEAKQELKRQIGHEQMRLVLRGTAKQIQEAKSYLASVDQPARQVSIEMRVMEVTKSEALKIGLDWSVLTGGRLTSLRMNQGLGNNIADGGSFSGNYQSNATDSLSVLGKLDAISTSNNLIAKPNALITDGRSSHLFVGDTIRYIKLINASQNGTTVEIGEVEVGVAVDVQARVGGDGNIALDLSQKFSILQGFTPVPGGGSIPQTSDRTAQMFVNMKHGETIALGGLILEQDRKSVSGIPILKDIPIIGYLFKRTDNRKEKSEIVFFVTATVVDNDMNARASGK
jgi:general secretion pathway protein D